MKVTMPDTPVEFRHLLDYLDKLGAAYILWVTKTDGKKVVGSVQRVTPSFLVIQPWDDVGPLPTAAMVEYTNISEIAGRRRDEL